MTGSIPSMPELPSLQPSASTPVALREALLSHFGHTSFRSAQEEILVQVLAGRDVIAVLPTGLGKSILYQLPAAMDRTGFTLVISPLISLMDDQLTALNERGIPAAFVNSNINADEAAEIYRRMQARELRLLYVAPERLSMPDFREAIKGVSIARIAVDEAHSVSVWGHGFRPDYLRIGAFRREFAPRAPILATTATATPRILTDLRASLGLDAPWEYIGDPARENISLHSEQFSGEAERRTRLLEIVRNKGQAGAPTIVYAPSVAAVLSIVDQLEEAGVSCTYYHGRLKPKPRIEAQTRFFGDKATVMVATKAFGMGIDKPDVRCIVHCGLPESVEQYWQEVGRAGRDGAPAEAHLLSTPFDAHLQRVFITANNPSVSIIRSVYAALWLRVPEECRNDAHPAAPFWGPGFFGRYGKSGEMKREMHERAFGLLEEYGLVLRAGRQLLFLVRPQDLQGRPFPIDQAMIDRRKELEELRLRVLMRYLDESDDPSRKLYVLDYFRSDAKLDSFEGISTDACLRFPESELRIALEYAATPDARFSGIARRLLQDPSRMMTESEATTFGHLLERAGYVAERRAGARRFLHLTARGREELLRLGGSVPAEAVLLTASTPEARGALLRNEIRPWIENARTACVPTADAWEVALQGFLDASFTIDGFPSLGRDIVAKHRGVPPKVIGPIQAALLLKELFPEMPIPYP